MMAKNSFVIITNERNVAAKYTSYSRNNKLTSHLAIILCYCTTIIRPMQIHILDEFEFTDG